MEPPCVAMGLEHGTNVVTVWTMVVEWMSLTVVVVGTFPVTVVVSIGAPAIIGEPSTPDPVPLGPTIPLPLLNGLRLREPLGRMPVGYGG